MRDQASRSLLAGTRRLPLQAVLVAAALLVFVLLLAGSVRTAFGAGPFTVTKTADTNDGVCDSDCSLREAIGAATAAGGSSTISLPPGTYQLTLGELKTGSSAGTNITLDGTGTPATTIIQVVQPGTCPGTPSTCVRAFDVDFLFTGGITFSISDVTITGGSGGAGGGGGAILDGDAGDVLNVTNVVFDGNTTNAFNGGAISFTGGGTLNVTDSTFTNNSSPTGNGGAIHFLQTQAGAFEVANSTFTGNSATGGALGGQGGAINVGCNICSPFTITNSTFTENTAVMVGSSGGQGGAIMLGSGSLALNYDRIVDNVGSSGTGIYDGGGTANATNDWWGCNSGPGGAGCDSAVQGSGSLTTSPFIKLVSTPSPNPIRVNQTTTLTASVLQNSSNQALTTSQVSTLVGLPVTWGGAFGGTLSATQATIQANGTATGTFTAAFAGPDTADAKVDSATATAHITVNQADTTTSITSESPDPSVAGQAVTVDFSVTSSTGTIPTAPTGDVTVSDGVDSCTGTVASGTCTIALTTAGARTLTASYGGDTNFNGSTSAGVGHTVSKADTTTTITSDTPDPSVVGQAVTVQFTVGVSAPGSGTPTGNVTVSDGTVSCTATVAAGQCPIVFTSAGSRSLTATYAGDSSYIGSSSTAEAHQVDPADTTTTITADSPDPSDAGQAVTVTFTVAPNAPGAGTPTGNVTVSDGVDSCTGTVAAGTCSITVTTQGSRTLTATYAGDSDFNGSTSAGEPHTVIGIATTTTITSDSPDPSVVGQSVTIGYTVSPAVAGGTPTGNVSVSDGTVSCTGTVAAGQCSLTFTSAGAKSLTATYAGDSNYSGSTSTVEPHEVDAAETTTVITSDAPDPSSGTQAVTVTYTVAAVSPGSGTPTGNVTVSDGVDSCTGTVGSGSCSVTLTTNGSRTLTATYAGDGNFNGSTSAGEPHTVDAIAPSVTIDQAAGQADPTGISPVHFTAVFSEPVTGFATGDVSLSGSAGATTAVVTEVAPNDGTTFDVAVSGMSADGSVIATIPAGVATDLVGNPSTASTSTDDSVTFQFDTTPPDTTIDSGPTNPTDDTSASFTFSGTDNVTPSASLTFQCELDGAAFATCTSPVSYIGLSLGSHTFQVRAIDAAGNVDPTPASFTWQVHAATTLLYDGAQIVAVGTSFQPAAKLSSTASGCVSGQTIAFSLDRDPFTGVAGPYPLGSAVTSGTGQATMTSISTSGWQEGIYDITARFAGTAACDASSDDATLTVATPGEAASGGGWYTLSGSGRVNFGFTVRKVDSTCTSSCAYKGSVLLINNGKWRVKGTLSGYVKLSTGQGSASGTGDLYWWDSSLNAGLGDWALAQSGVAFAISFYDSGKSGKSSTDTFGIEIVYAPVSPPQPANLPNSTPQLLKGGDIKVS